MRPRAGPANTRPYPPELGERWEKSSTQFSDQKVGDMMGTPVWAAEICRFHIYMYVLLYISKSQSDIMS